MQSYRGALLSPGREAGRTARGLASPELNVLIALELLRVFAGGNYPRDLRWGRECGGAGLIWEYVECC